MGRGATIDCIRSDVIALRGAGCNGIGRLDQLLLEATPPPLRRRVLSVSTSGLMFWQGLGFGLAGAGAELEPARIVIPTISIIGLVALMRLAPGLRRGPAIRSSSETPHGV